MDANFIPVTYDIYLITFYAKIYTKSIISVTIISISLSYFVGGCFGIFYILFLNTFTLGRFYVPIDVPVALHSLCR